MSRLMLCMWMSSCSSNICWKVCSFSLNGLCHIWSKITCLYLCGGSTLVILLEFSILSQEISHRVRSHLFLACWTSYIFLDVCGHLQWLQMLSDYAVLHLVFPFRVLLFHSIWGATLDLEWFHLTKSFFPSLLSLK